MKIKVRQCVELSAFVLHVYFSGQFGTRQPQSVKYRLGHGDSIPVQTKGHNFPTPAATVGGTQPVIDTFVEPPSSAAGRTRDGNISSRSSSLEAGPRRTCSHIPRSESAGGTRGLAQGVACDENREAADTVDGEKVL